MFSSAVSERVGSGWRLVAIKESRVLERLENLREAQGHEDMAGADGHGGRCRGQ